MSRRGADTRQRVGLPSVNLLPESAFTKMAARRLRRRFAAGVVAMVLLVGAAWGVQHVRVTDARKLVAVERAETNRLTSQTEVLAPVRTFVNGVALQQGTAHAVMANEVYLSDVLDGVRSAAPAGARLASVEVTITGLAAATGAEAAPPAAAASACPGPDPFNTRTVVGCVTLSGVATSRSQVGEMVVRLGRAGLFIEPFISTTTTADSDEVSFSGSVGLSERVFSKRYADPADSDGTGDTDDDAGATGGGS